MVHITCAYCGNTHENKKFKNARLVSSINIESISSFLDKKFQIGDRICSEYFNYWKNHKISTITHKTEIAGDRKSKNGSPSENSALPDSGSTIQEQNKKVELSIEKKLDNVPTLQKNQNQMFLLHGSMQLLR